MSIDVRRLAKRFAGTPAVDDISFRVPPGELVAVLGPSGSGKSTLLRMIAGLEIPDTGTVSLAGRDATLLPPRERNVGFVFQHYALFRHMTVSENIAFGLTVRHVGRKEADARVAELLDLVQLKGMERRRPAQLSGGQRQRVAVARALAPRPSVLLLDEPFGALDAQVREDLRRWISELHEQTHVTTLFVTHDQHEALEIAHRIIVMNRGRIEQEGTPVEIFDRPATPFVADFVGENNFIEASVSEPHGVRWGPFLFSVNGHPPGHRMNISFRPGDVTVSRSARENAVRGRIARSRFKGATVELALAVGAGSPIIAHVPRRDAQTDNLAAGAEVYISIAAYNAFSQDGVEHAGEAFHAVRPLHEINSQHAAVSWKV